jgi:hypothetical protein
MKSLNYLFPQRVQVTKQRESERVGFEPTGAVRLESCNPAGFGVQSFKPLSHLSTHLLWAAP